MTNSWILRDARLPEDEATIKRFILGSNAAEKPIEDDRREDAGAADEYWPVLEEMIRTRNGRMIMAQAEGRVIGYVALIEHEHPPFVRAMDRRHGFIVELFVEPDWRRKGIAASLLRAAEDHCRARGLGTVHLGVLPGNEPARAAYETGGYRTYALELRKRL